jgi:hypothetical protein
MRLLTVCAFFPLLVCGLCPGYGNATSDQNSAIPNIMPEMGATVTIVNQFYIPDGANIAGLSIAEVSGLDHVGFPSYLDKKLYYYHLDGSLEIGVSLIYSGNVYPWDMCYSPESERIFIDDFVSPTIFYTTDLLNWDSYPNPAGAEGKGLEWTTDISAPTLILEANYSGFESGVYMFTELAELSAYYEVTYPPFYLTGVTVFPFNGEYYLMLMSSEYDYFYFYTSTVPLTLLGYAEFPIDFEGHYDIAYCDSRDSFYMSGVDNGQYCIYELHFNFYNVGIQSKSLGSMKALYH